jgi:hypothetical protein
MDNGPEESKDWTTQVIDLYKMRAEEYEKRYEDMRDYEWKLLLQVYAGYAAMVIAFTYLTKGDGSSPLQGHVDSTPLAVIFMGITIVFFSLTCYMTNRVQERLIRFDGLRLEYIKKIHSILIKPEIETELFHRDRYFWTFRTQSATNLFVCLAVLSYEFAVGFPPDSNMRLWTRMPVIMALYLLFGTIMYLGLVKRLQKHITPYFIWYAAYGSNLSEARFLCYIYGGKPDGSTSANEGCREKLLPVAKESLTIEGKLYFAKDSSSWGEGGVAFIDPESPGKTLGRIYKIRYNQFLDIFAQENDQKPGGRRLLPPLYKLVDKPKFVARVNGWYSRVIHLGERDGYPIFTFTGSKKEAEKDVRIPPPRNYVVTIARGLKEAYPEMHKKAIGDYLLSCDGVAGNVSSEQINDWVSD